MKTRLLSAFALVAILLAGSMRVSSFILDDADGDGVPDSVDVCPAEDASYFDRDGDGCLDADRGARHIEYWGSADSLITYVINATGSPDVGDGSDVTAVQAAMNAWPGVAGTELDVAYGGTTPQEVADALDQVNLVTFIDDEFRFSSLVLAVGVTTSFTVDSLYNGRLYRAGEIVDADMIFNPAKTFKTSTSGPAYGTDIQSTATHEAGHLYGISHSAIRSSTMFYVLPGGNGARTLETDDQLIYLKAYADAPTRASANRITGTVTDGQTSDPVPGAIVFAIETATGDTAACDYTLPDGSYTFMGLSDGSYYVAIHPLNGTAPIGYIQPGNINALVESTAAPVFVPEYYDAAESNADDEHDKTALAVAGGGTVVADLVTNMDNTPPAVVYTIPADNAAGVAIDGAFVIRFSEAIEPGTLASAFRFRRIPDGAGVGGNIAVLSDDTLIAFTPTSPLDFETDYRLTLDTLLTDQYGNQLPSAFVLDVTTETEPPLSISSLSPNKGVVNTTVVINGRGFDVVPPPTVSFNGTGAAVTEAFPNKLVVTVPVGTSTGPVTVTNTSDASVSNSLTFTLLSSVEIARGYETGVVELSSAPTSLTLVPDDSYAYVGTGTGAEAVVVDPALAGYLTSESIAYAGGLDGVATTPEGRRVYGVSKGDDELVEIMSDPTSGLLFNTVLSSHAIGAMPLGIVIDPAGRRAYIPTDDAEIQVWDVELGSATYQRQINAIPSPGGLSLRGQMAITPDGAHLLALADAGELFIFETGPDSLLQTVHLGVDPRDVIVDPVGQRAYVSHDNGDVSVVKLSFLAGPSFLVQSIVTGGSLRGMDITPAATYINATDRALDEAKIIDLDETNPTFRTVITDFPLEYNPVAMEISSDGVYGFSVLQGYAETSPRLVVTTIGIGPTLSTIYPRAARPGNPVTLSGNQLGDIYNVIDIDFAGGSNFASDIYSGEKLVTSVPASAVTGPVKVTKVSDVPPHESQTSNEVYFKVLDPSPDSGIRFAGSVGVGASFGLEPTIAISPDGDLAFVGGSDGEVHIFSIDPSSPDFHQEISVVDVADPGPIFDLAVSVDGKFLFVTTTAYDVFILHASRTDPDFGELWGTVDWGVLAFYNVTQIAVSPDNQFILVYDDEVSLINIIDVAGLANGIRPTISDQVPVGKIADMVIDAAGQKAYVARDFPDVSIGVVSLETRSANFGQLIDNEPMPAEFGFPPFVARGLAMRPDGSRLLANAFDPIFGHELIEFNTSPLASDTISVADSWLLGVAVVAPYAPVKVSPRGDRAIWSRFAFGFNYYKLGDDPALIVSHGAYVETLAPYDFAFTPDGNRVYVASSQHDSLRVYDFAAASNLAKVSGDAQSGVAGQALPAPLRVQVSALAGGSVEGVALEFSTSDGAFATPTGAASNLVVATDEDGYAEATWLLDAALGAKSATVASPGLGGSPLTFTATGVEDPATLPLVLSQVIPLTNSANQSVTTALQATFSRGVDRSTVADSTLWIEQLSSSTKVPAAVGYTDHDRKVSLTPINPLNYGDHYEVHFTPSLKDTSDGGLTNPMVSTFSTTASAPPPAISAINPPSGLTGIYVTISGAGFATPASSNTVNFGGGASITPVAGSVDYLTVKVPHDAVTGDVTVTTPSATSNPKPFTVLVPSSSPIDDVIATIGVGGTRSLAITPDGTMAYTLSTDGDIVIPVSVDSLVSYDAISVGDEPVAIAIHPEGTFAYVANFGSGSVSIIDIVPGTPDYNTVVSTLVVGANPLDVAAVDDRVFVANAGSGEVSVIDSDESSVTHHSVIATIGVGGARSLTITPDGARLYIGTDNGFVVMDVSSYGVIATVGVSGGGKSLTISPDGTLLYVLTDAGDIVVYNVEPGSPDENSVIATIGVGGAKSLTISPDGTLLFLVQEDSDAILVLEVAVIGGTSVLGSELSAPQYTLSFTAVDTIEAEDAAEIAFDPSGSGVGVITQAGKITVLNASPFPLGPLAVEVVVEPHTLQLDSKGRYVTAYVEFPLAYSPHEVDVSTVRLQGVIPAETDKVAFTDRDGDGTEEIVLKFDRIAFQQVLPIGEFVPVTVSGKVRDRDFEGETTIRTVRPTVLHPTSGDDVPPATTYAVQWSSPAGYPVHHVDVDYSLDDGATWHPIAAGIPDYGFVSWTTPTTLSGTCRVLVTLYEDETDVLGMGMSEMFSIMLPVSVALQSFDVSVEEGTALLRWRTGLEVGMVGFHLARSTSRDGEYTRVTGEMIPARGGAYGSAYEYRDEGVRPNTTYFYKLQEVAENGGGIEFGPYEVSYRLVNDLSQNVPNPFNPNTAIKFSIADDTHVLLVVYDVAGRRVRTLVDENRRADIYRMVWDGRNDQGERVASGVYFYRLKAGKYTQTKKMMLLK